MTEIINAADLPWIRQRAMTSDEMVELANEAIASWRHAIEHMSGRAWMSKQAALKHQGAWFHWDSVQEVQAARAEERLEQNGWSILWENIHKNDGATTFYVAGHLCPFQIPTSRQAEDESLCALISTMRKFRTVQYWHKYRAGPMFEDAEGQDVIVPGYERYVKIPQRAEPI